MTKQSTRVWARLAVVGMAALLVGASVGAASARRPDGVGPRYVALGDSLAFGYSPLLEEPWTPACFVGYPELIAQRRGPTTTNLSCPGQTARALVSRTAADAGRFEQRDEAAAAGVALLHADYPGSQLDAALEAVRSDVPPTLITIQGGANDMTMCMPDDSDDAGDSDAADISKCLDDVMPKVTKSLQKVVTRLRAAGSKARVALVGYHLAPGLEPQVRRVNRAVELAARRSHVVYVDTAHPFERYARRHHGDLCTTGLLVELPDGSCDIHPSPTGQSLVADAVLKAAVRERQLMGSGAPAPRLAALSGQIAPITRTMTRSKLHR